MTPSTAEAPSAGLAAAATSATQVPTSLACAELARFDPRQITALPRATTLQCRRVDGGGPVVVTTSQAVYEAVRASRWPVFAGSELWAMTLAAEHDRAWPSTLAEWCASKAEDPHWRLTDVRALGGIAEPVSPRGWVLEQVLGRLGLELEWVGCDSELPGCVG